MDAKLIIDNNYLDTESRKDVFSPWEGQHLGSIGLASAGQATHAIEAATKAWQDWKKTTVNTRIQLLYKAAKLITKKREDIALTLCLEIGKTISDARSEVDRAIEYITLTADAAKSLRGSVYYGDVFSKYDKDRKTGFYTRYPLGVVLAISPFNYPLNLSITKVAPALVTGNTVVVKSATVGSLSSFMFYSCLIEAGFPAGVLNFLSGKSSEIGDLLVTDSSIQLIAFTGSSSVGNHIRKISLGVPLLLELGGKDAALVLEDTNIELASSQIIKGAFSYSGQRCTAQKIVYVVDSIEKTLEFKLIEDVKNYGLSPLIDSETCDYIDELKQDAISKGAKIVVNGKRSGNKMSPTILSDVTAEMRIYHEEQFGPILPIVKIKTISDGVNAINDSKYALQASIYTQDIDKAFSIANALEVGTVQINGKPDRGPDNFPFGGVRESGQMMQGLHESFDLMTRGKLTVLNLNKQNLT